MARRVIIMGAAGRDFHNFNTVYRDNPDYTVVAFTAHQIPGIEGRRYPRELAGRLYPEGIPIYPEGELLNLIKSRRADEVVFSYSDVSHEYVMHRASEALSACADFRLLGPDSTMLVSSKPVISVCAVRTGAGKSPVARRIARLLKAGGIRVAIMRHPMPYGILEKQACQKFETLADLDRHEATIEEREDYEPHLRNGFPVYAGVDYECVLREAEKAADVIVWDGGNNDYSFLKSDLYITVADAYRPGHGLLYHPGEVNLRMADVVVVNKVDPASEENAGVIEENVRRLNPHARLIRARLKVSVEDPAGISGKRVLVIEDGPTVTHGGMGFGAAYIAAKESGAGELIDPRKYAVGTVAEVFKEYPHLKEVLPAVGYSERQVADLQETIRRADCEAVVSGTPMSLLRIMKIDKPFHQVGYEMEGVGEPTIDEIIKSFIREKGLGVRRIGA